MSIQIHSDLEQGTEAWLAVRRGMVTASVVGQLITAKTLKPAANDYSRALTNTLVAERITGWTDPVYVSDDMFRGTVDEPVARDLYSQHWAPVTEVGFMVLDEGDWRLGYSPDGLVGETGLIEVKSRRPKKHLATILANEVPAENIAQCQAGLLVSGREWLDYVSFCAGMPLYIRRVYPDPAWHKAIAEAVQAFEAAAAEIVATYEQRIAGLPMTERVDRFAGIEF